MLVIAGLLVLVRSFSRECQAWGREWFISVKRVWPRLYYDGRARACLTYDFRIG